ncbi:MAG: ornithine carbamoyltransferase [Alphaproteobacteria bacterium]|nr:ornithine carbamoyltransferase [Alphaproteobacteria bacterium]
MSEIDESYRNFLDIRDISSKDLRHIVAHAKQLKQERQSGVPHNAALAGKILAMGFEKPSTRTRVSFDVGMRELGGSALFLSKNDIQMGHGESIPDTAKVLSRFVSAILLRCHGHHNLLHLAHNATVPVINGLTDYNHPCQIMADIITFEEFKGDISGRTIAWVGDGNNVANTWIAAAQRFGFVLKLACPKSLLPCEETVAWAQSNGAKIELTSDAQEAVAGADAVVADTWVSMGQDDAEQRKALLAPYQVNDALMAFADPQAIFMHCLPAHRGEEVTNSVIDGAQSVVFDEAENRLHAQKAILLWCFKVI